MCLKWTNLTKEFLLKIALILWWEPLLYWLYSEAWSTFLMVVFKLLIQPRKMFWNGSWTSEPEQRAVSDLQKSIEVQWWKQRQFVMPQGHMRVRGKGMYFVTWLIGCFLLQELWVWRLAFQGINSPFSGQNNRQLDACPWVTNLYEMMKDAALPFFKFWKMKFKPQMISLLSRWWELGQIFQSFVCSTRGRTMFYYFNYVSCKFNFQF